MLNFNKGLLFPANAYHEIGPFRFPIHNDLTPAEATKIVAIEKEYSKGSYDSMRLAKKIAKARNISNQEAVDLLQNLNTADDSSIVFDYIDEIEELNNSQENTTAKLQAYALMLLQYRGEVKHPDTAEWESTDKWELEDTNIIPIKVLTSMLEFVLWERDGWPKSEGTEGNEKITKTRAQPKATST
jgi:hypothetical protein